ncbi:MAG: helix-turn-helix transcriptional regulator [Bacteroidaceae bacterium]|nr:helix-turn-helix transcriptional regulator [Bacteroidaceae bacterium]
MTEKNLNRIKVMLVEKKQTAKRLADQLGKDPTTVSKWCTNTTQPSLENLIRISELLEVPIQELIRTNGKV